MVNTALFLKSPVLQFVTPSMYADDTEIYASSKHGDELVANLNCDLENVHKWIVQKRLQIHPTKTKYMYIGSSYNTSSNPILINNIPVPRTENYTCLGVSLDERLTWEKHIDTICRGRNTLYRLFVFTQ